MELEGRIGRGKVRLTDLTPSELGELHQYFLNYIIPSAAKRAYSRIGLGNNRLNVQMDDIISELSEKYCKVLDKLRRDENSGKKPDPYPLAGYIVNSIFNASRNSVTEYYSSVAETDRIVLRHIPEDGEEVEETDGRGKDMREAVRELAGKLGVKADEDDWVDTIVRCAISPNRKALTCAEKAGLDSLVERLKENGYVSSGGKLTAKRGLIGRISSKMVEDNPEVTAEEVMKELRRMGVDAKLDSVRSRVKEARRKMGIKLARTYVGSIPLPAAMMELWNEGVQDRDQMTEMLKRRGVVFKPRLVYVYHKNLSSYGALQPPEKS